MTGDGNDMLARIKAVLPARWFPDATPLLDGLVTGLADASAWLYALLGNVKLQARLATATGGFLDMIGNDYFGARVLRRAGQGDAAFRARIETELLRERGTRPALIAVLEEMTGRTPIIFEPARPADTRAWGIALGYGAAGGWGSLMLPFQCFVTAYRPLGQGIGAVNGWGSGGGGWGSGVAGYGSMALAASDIGDADIMAAIAGVMPVAAVAWTKISN
jgi:hypothetical protein